MRRKRQETAKKAKEPNQPAGKAKKGKGEAVEKDVGKGKGHQQQLKALETQLVHEEAKHRRRVARLHRIRELAIGENDTKTIERVEKLIEKEQQRYVRKQQRMQERRQKILPLAPPLGGAGLAEESLSEQTLKASQKGKGKEKAKEQTKSKDKDTEEEAEE